MAENKKVEVPLSLVLDAIDMMGEGWCQFLDIEDMKIAAYPSEAEDMDFYEEDPELLEQIEEDDGSRFYRLPEEYDINNYDIMQNFICSLSEGDVQEHLLSATRGSGAFRRFRDGIARYDLEQDWYKFEEASYIEIAKEWCEKNGLSYDDDIERLRAKRQAASKQRTK